MLDDLSLGPIPRISYSRYFSSANDSNSPSRNKQQYTQDKKGQHLTTTSRTRQKSPPRKDSAPKQSFLSPVALQLRLPASGSAKMSSTATARLETREKCVEDVRDKISCISYGPRLCGRRASFADLKQVDLNAGNQAIRKIRRKTVGSRAPSEKFQQAEDSEEMKRGQIIESFMQFFG